MQLVYNREESPPGWKKSIFLAGPTPRSAKVRSWRLEALRLLEEYGYDGVVFVPENRNGIPDKDFDYQEQVDWEHRNLNRADCILFWVPRDLRKLPGFTTNVEFGLWANSGKVVFGSPPNAQKNRYLKLISEKLCIPQADSLRKAIEQSLKFLGDGVWRQNGERDVPLYIWRTTSFQAWYQAQKNAGNRLDGAEVSWVFRIGLQKDRVYCWAMKVNVYVAKENRNKTNEIVIARPDIFTVVLYRREREVLKSQVVLIREFRSPASTKDGFIWEIPGGSSWTNTNPQLIAVQEVREETGLEIGADRLQSHRARQLAGTFSVHKAHLFSAALRDEELKFLERQFGIPRGDLKKETGERTYVEIKTVEEIISERLVDWSNIGMIMSVICEENL